MVMTMIGASMLWVGWFGFNVGSNLEANGGATSCDDQHLHRDGGGDGGLDRASRRCSAARPRMLGAASGMVAGLVAVTPACGTIGPMGAIILGIDRGGGLLLSS
jgi:Amt family ammonium transporter